VAYRRAARREGIEFLWGLSGLNIIAVDVNTVSPPHDVHNTSAFLAAQIIYESLVLLCQNPS
jgi:agmatinase